MAHNNYWSRKWPWFSLRAWFHATTVATLAHAHGPDSVCVILLVSRDWLLTCTFAPRIAYWNWLWIMPNMSALHMTKFHLLDIIYNSLSDHKNIYSIVHFMRKADAFDLRRSEYPHIVSLNISVLLITRSSAYQIVLLYVVRSYYFGPVTYRLESLIHWFHRSSSFCLTSVDFPHS